MPFESQIQQFPVGRSLLFIAPLMMVACGAPASSGSTETATGTTSTETVETSEGTTATEGTERWAIAAERVPCEGVAPMRCLRVREGEGDWTLFYDAIEGFDPVEGQSYVVDVRRTPIENPPADGSSIRTTLVRIVSGGTPCTAQSDCPDGQRCAGPEGCDTQWVCQPSSGCTRDHVSYCTCEGETVGGSGSCPPAPYAHRGPC